MTGVALTRVGNVREFLKNKVTKIQSSVLSNKMLMSSKMDRFIVNGFEYSGKSMRYLNELSFLQARAIFMTRCRMWPTKANYPGRWSGSECNVCGLNDTDEHIPTCPGYYDIVAGKFEFGVFWDKVVLEDMEKLKILADVVIILIERMEKIQSIG